MLKPVATEIATPPLPLTVLYDGACPLYRREIGVYRALKPCARHGQLLSGARVRLMEHSYRLFLRWRPMLQRWANRLDRQGAAPKPLPPTSEPTP